MLVFYEYEFARQTLANYMITAIWLKDKLTTKQFKVVDKYIDNIYEKLIKQENTSK